MNIDKINKHLWSIISEIYCYANQSSDEFLQDLIIRKIYELVKLQ